MFSPTMPGFYEMVNRFDLFCQSPVQDSDLLLGELSHQQSHIKEHLDAIMAFCQKAGRPN